MTNTVATIGNILLILVYLMIFLAIDMIFGGIYFNMMIFGGLELSAGLACLKFVKLFPLNKQLKFSLCLCGIVYMTFLF